MNNNSCHRLFVYGSLRRDFNSPAYEYVSQYFNLVDHAKTKGLLFDTGEFPAAIPTEDELFIQGELYEIKIADEFAWAIAQLDDYEGINGSFDEPSMYRRAIAKIILPNGDETEAWVFWYTGSVEGKPRIISGDLVEYIQSQK
jgi:gamma-glutamylcyclotransferase (GGCT)/AIG2-like uncharacterized protein YtfP